MLIQNLFFLAQHSIRYGNKLGQINANLAVDMRDPKSKAMIHALFNK